MKELSVVSYNIHKGFSLFRRKYTLIKIKKQLELIDPDLVFLQEVRGLCPKGEHANQLEHLADSIWPHTAYGKNAIYQRAHHGNAILSRYPLDRFENKNVSVNRFESRGILYSQIRPEASGPGIHVFCLHLNLLEKDRHIQIDELLNFLNAKTQTNEPVIIGGDFNDWTGALTKRLETHLDHWSSPEENLKTYPSFFPILKLDRIFIRNIDWVSIQRLDSNPWRQLSDHLPLVARMTLRF